MLPPSVNFITVVFTICKRCQAASPSLMLCLTPRVPCYYVERQTSPRTYIVPQFIAKLLLDMFSGKRVSSLHHELIIENEFDKMVSEILIKVSQIPCIGQPPFVTRRSTSQTAIPKLQHGQAFSHICHSKQPRSEPNLAKFMDHLASETATLALNDRLKTTVHTRSHSMSS